MDMEDSKVEDKRRARRAGEEWRRGGPGEQDRSEMRRTDLAHARRIVGCRHGGVEYRVRLQEVEERTRLRRGTCCAAALEFDTLSMRPSSVCRRTQGAERVAARREEGRGAGSGWWGRGGSVREKSRSLVPVPDGLSERSLSRSSCGSQQPVWTRPASLLSSHLQHRQVGVGAPARRPDALVGGLGEGERARAPERREAMGGGGPAVVRDAVGGVRVQVRGHDSLGLQGGEGEKQRGERTCWV
eukprot:753795-Hanusia_phi.AAC.2